MVGTPNRKYLWFLARTPTVDYGLYARLVEEARAAGVRPGPDPEVLACFVAFLSSSRSPGRVLVVDRAPVCPLFGKQLCQTRKYFRSGSRVYFTQTLYQSDLVGRSYLVKDNMAFLALKRTRNTGWIVAPLRRHGRNYYRRVEAGGVDR